MKERYRVDGALPAQLDALRNTSLNAIGRGNTTTVPKFGSGTSGLGIIANIQLNYAQVSLLDSMSVAGITGHKIDENVRRARVVQISERAGRVSH